MSKRVLVVDDEKEFSALLRYRLQGDHYEVACASSGTEALTKAQNFSPDVILLDLLLPDLDGISVCEILRRQPMTRDTPIIMISALTSEPTHTAAKFAGVSAYFGKPLDFAALKRMLETLLNL